MRSHHLVMIPFPAQGHLTSVLNLAKLLHSRGFYITFVVTEFTRRRLVRSRGAEAVGGLEGFRFETVPDGLPPPSDEDATQDIPSLCLSLLRGCFLAPFLDLLRRLDGRRGADGDDGVPPRVTGIVADGSMFFALDAAAEMGIPVMLFYTISGCGFLGYLNYPELVKRGYTPLKDESCLTNGYLDTRVDWIPGMEGIRLRDLPSFLRTTDPDDVMLQTMLRRAECARRADGVILNSFEDLERGVLSGLRSPAFGLRSLYAVGPLSPLSRRVPSSSSSSVVGSNLLEEDARCIEWLDRQAEGSVVYVNYGSIAVLTARELEEFARGLAGSGHPFLWVVRRDMAGGATVGFAEEEGEVAGRSMVAGWCDQEAVLAHRAVGGFLTHCGWNSTLESVWEGVPMICWPFFAEQPTNCRYACGEWGVGADMGGEVRRERVEEVVREVMGRGKGEEMRGRAREWKEKARRAIEAGGTSYDNMERLVQDLANMKRLL